MIDLPAATARAPEIFGGILGVRQAPDGKVLVNDARRRQLKLYDSTLTTSVIVRDSTPGSATSYGRLGTPLIPYRGDSSIIADWNASTMLVLDAHGQVVRGAGSSRAQHDRASRTPDTRASMGRAALLPIMRSRQRVRHSPPNRAARTTRTRYRSSVRISTSAASTPSVA